MPRFSYRAVEANGTVHEGVLDASDQAQAAGLLHNRGLLVMRLQAGRDRLWPWSRSSQLGQEPLLRFTQQMAILLDAGQPLEQALTVLIKQPGREGLGVRALIERIRERVKGGVALSTAMAQEDGQFSALYLSLVRAGEASGALQDTLRQLGDYLERRQALRGQVINALIYPAFLIIGVLGALLLLMGYVVPQFAPIFSDLGVPLPLITEWILNSGLFLAAYWLWIAALLMLTVVVVPAYWRHPARRLRLHRHLLGLPTIGVLVQRLEAARLARTLGTLLINGVPLLEALGIARQVCANVAIAGLVDVAIEAVRNGGSFACALDNDHLLPALALQMIQVGEQAGQLDRMLLKVADVFDLQAQRSIARMLAALVPSLTLIMAVLVGVIMLAIMLPLMSLTNSL